MAVRVRIKAGSVEFEYEGETELGVSDIKDLFSYVETLFKAPVLAEGGDPHTAAQTPDPAMTNGEAKPSTSQMLHVNSIATKLKSRTGPDLAVAAAAALQIYAKQANFSRAELIGQMKQASMHYKASMSKNLTPILQTLVGTKFNQVSDGVYSLIAEEHHKLETQLA